MPNLRERLLQRVEAALNQPDLNQPNAGSP
jgi:hypothetical protein